MQYRTLILSVCIIPILFLVVSPVFADTFTDYARYSLANSGSTSTITFTQNSTAFVKLVTDAPKAYNSTINLLYYKLGQEPTNRYSLAKYTYQYINLQFEAAPASKELISNVITFRVPVSWLKPHNAKYSQIGLYYFDTVWKKASIDYLYTEKDYHYMQAIVPQFGYFAIAMDTTAAAGQTQDTPAAQSNNTTSVVQPQVSNEPDIVFPFDEEVTSSTKSNWTNMIGLGMLVLSCVGIIATGTSLVRTHILEHKKHPKLAPVTPTPSHSHASHLVASLREKHSPESPEKQQEKHHVTISSLLSKYKKSEAKPDAVSEPFTADETLESDQSYGDAVALQEKIDELEPDIVRKYITTAVEKGMDIAEIKMNLLEHDVDESLIDIVYSSVISESKKA